MLWKISIRNVKRCFKDYVIYFLTLILGVAVFYVFNSLDNQTVMMNVSSSTREIMKMMVTILSGVSVFVSFVLGFLIIYASRFLMKRRHKEFAIYMTLGMSKYQISFLLLWETLIIGVVSLAIGLCVGVSLSQVMSMFVASMFEVNMQQFEFVFSMPAMMKTILYFSIIYVVVMIFHVFFIGKQKLIDLLMSVRKNENLKTKNLWLCSLVFVVGVMMLSYAYYRVTGGVNQLNTVDKIMLPIALGIISTFMIFYSVSGFILKIVMSCRSRYFKHLHMFTLRQVSSQMNTTVASMSIICLMLFMTICILSSSLALKEASVDNIKELVPVDVYLEKNWDLSGNKANGKPYSQEEINYSHQSLSSLFEQLGLKEDEYFKEKLFFNEYATNDLLWSDTLGEELQAVQNEYPYLRVDTAETIIRISDYNALAKMYGQPTYTLNEGQYIMLANFPSMSEIRNRALAKQTPIQLLGKTYTPQYTTCQDGFIVPAPNETNTGIILVPDHAIDDSIRARQIMVANYNANDRLEKQELETKLLDILNKNEAKTMRINETTKIAIYDSSVGLGAMVTFIGIYLGIVFLISSAAILALKQLSDSTDNKERYQILRRIGTDERMIHRSLFMQVALFFVAPLSLAIIHSVFGIQFCLYILQSFGTKQLLSSIIISAIFIILIYGSYLLLTYIASKQMLKEE